MKPCEMIIQTLHEIEAELRAKGVLNLWLFGSCARGESDAADADFLVEFVSRPTFINFMDLKFLLEEKLEMPVDLYTRNSCPDRFMNRIQQDLLHVA